MTPVEITRLYYRDVWSEHRVERIAALCADPVQRHDPHGDYALTHAQQQQRILERAPSSASLECHSRTALGRALGPVARL